MRRLEGRGSPAVPVLADDHISIVEVGFEPFVELRSPTSLGEHLIIPQTLMHSSHVFPFVVLRRIELLVQPIIHGNLLGTGVGKESLDVRDGVRLCKGIREEGGQFSVGVQKIVVRVDEDDCSVVGGCHVGFLGVGKDSSGCWKLCRDAVVYIESSRLIHSPPVDRVRPSQNLDPSNILRKAVSLAISCLEPRASSRGPRQEGDMNGHGRSLWVNLLIYHRSGIHESEREEN